MSTNRRLNLRKGKNNNNDGNQSISNFVQKRSKDPVEIEDDDDDEVVHLTDQYTCSEEQVLRPLKRQKKKIVVEENDDEEETNNYSNELEGMEDMDEDEKEQMKEALRQSRLELEKEEQRRKIYQMFETAKFNAAAGIEIPTTSEADIPSSPISSSIEPQCVERAESPDLFAPTPQSSKDQDKKYDVTSSESSSSKSEVRSCKKSPFKKEINIQLSPIKRPLPMRNLSFKIEKEASPNHKETSDDKSTSTCTVTNKGKDRINKLCLDSKKRKHSIEDDSDDDGAKENHKEAVPAESRKRQKTLEDNFHVLKSKNPKMEKKEKQQTKHFVIEDDDDNQDGSESDNRNTSTKKHKKSFRVSLKRAYKKPRLPIKTVRDAMKARLFFAPPGIDHKLYTFAIIRMLDRTKECIRKAQQNSLQFVKWGLPIIAGPRDGDSLDAKMDKRKSHVARKEPASDNPPELKTRRSLRSAQSKVNELLIKTESNQTTTTAVKTEKDSTDSTQISTKNLGYVQSDDSDEELTKPVFGHKENIPKSWKEYNAKADFFKFGENINTSATCISKDDEKINELINDKDNKKDKDSESNKDDRRNKDTDSKKHENILSDSAASTGRKPTSGFDNACKKELFQDSDSLNPTNTYFTDDMAKATFCTSKEAPIEKSTKQPTHTHKENQNIHIGADSSSKLASQDMENFPVRYVQRQNDPEVNDSDDGIDSSTEIGKMKAKRLSHKAPVIDEEEGDNETSEDEVEMVDIVESGPTGSNSPKPGKSLSVLAAKSGYLKVSRNGSNPPAIQRKVTPAVQKAAEAAERRMRKEKPAKTSGSSIEPPKKADPIEKKVVECPMCYSNFPLEDIEGHAAMCDGTVLEQPRKTSGMVGQQEQKRVYPIAQQTEEYGLKDLRVVVTRSPEVQRRLEEQESNSSLKAKRNLSLTKRRRVDTEKKVKEVVDMTSDDDDNTPKWLNNNKSQSKDDSQGTSQNVTWLTTESQEMRKKAKYKVTYGGKKKMATPKNPFSTLDFVPLQEQPASSESDSEADAITRKPQQQTSKNDTLVANGVHTTPNGPLSSKGKAPCNDCVDIDSASDSDTELFSMYGVKENPMAVRNINDVLHPKKQDVTFKKKKTKRRDSFDEDDYANERALMELAGISDKSPFGDYQPLGKRPSSGHQSKASKRRRKRATISSDDSDEDELCFVCNKRVLKETFHEHTKACLSKRGGSTVTPSKPLGNASPSGASTSSSRQTARPSTSNTVEMDSDEIGDSPIKTFKLIGEEETSVDFENQFAFFGNKNPRSSSNRGSKGGRGRGRGRGRFKKKWRKKKN